QLQMFAHHRRRLLAEWIGVLIRYHSVILASHVAFVAYREPWRLGDTYLFYEFNEHTSKLVFSANGFDAAIARNTGGVRQRGCGLRWAAGQQRPHPGHARRNVALVGRHVRVTWPIDRSGLRYRTGCSSHGTART